MRLLLASVLVAAATPAAAADQPSERWLWFESLEQPGTGRSCCSIADCLRTDADWRDGGWWVEMHGHWVEVPAERILAVKSIDGSAYVCAAVDPLGFARPMPEARMIAVLRAGILCFVPPDMGS